MPSVSVDEVRKVMEKVEQIRSMSVIAHVDHGKSTLTDSLVCRAGIISAKQAGEARFTDGRSDEKERGVTIKSTGVSLCVDFDEEEGPGAKRHLINLIDSPGHVDFSSEVTAALRITDGALVVVDCIEGCAVQTETVLRQALQERVRPVVFINKMDRTILELQMEPEEIYLRCRRAIEDTNVIIATYHDALMGELQVSPEKGNVAFGSGLHGWGFSLERFAKIYSSKLGVDREKMVRRLWGDHFYNAKKRTWTNVRQPEGAEEPLERAFCQFIMKPIAQLMQAIMGGEKEKYEPMMASLGIVLRGEDQKLIGKALMKRSMQLWINVADTMLALIVRKLPSPREAQKYRVGNLYEGPMDDEAAAAIRACEASGPLMMYVSKMIPTQDKGRFYAFGRVFSGTVAGGQRVRIQGPHYRLGGKEDLHLKSVQRTLVMMGHVPEPVADVPCGNTVALVGVDQFILKSGTITTLETAHNFCEMKYSVSPVVKVALRVKEGRDLPKLVEGLKRLSKSDQLVVCRTEENGEQVLAGCGELHVEVCLKDLREHYAQCDFTVSEPVVPFRETVLAESSQVCLAKSPNKLNRIYLQAQPMAEELTTAMESGALGPKAEAKERARALQQRFQWDSDQARKIWCWGPEMEGGNVVVDATVGLQHLQEARDHVQSAFQWASKEGPLCEESMRGIRFNIMDMTLHGDSMHRGAGQLMPTMRRCCFAAELSARPTLQEPLFLVEITCPREVLSAIYSCLGQRRGSIFEENPREGTPLVHLKAHLPVQDSFGFVAELRQLTSGQAFPQCVFDHWRALPSPALEPGKTQDLLLAIRQRKSLRPAPPALSDFLDKL